MNQIYSYILIGGILLFLDFCYLSMIKKYFDLQIRTIQGSNIQINYLGAIVTYFFLIFGLNYFIISKKKSVKDAVLLGLVIYGVYEFTNVSLLKKWFLLTAFMDTTWGAILFGLTTFIYYKLTKQR